MSGGQEHPGNRGSDSEGDYGYDLAHEVNAALDHIPRPRAAPAIPLTVASAASFTSSLTVDLHGDLGYDSAHEGGS
jgi:hypothetical protein